MKGKILYFHDSLSNEFLKTPLVKPDLKLSSSQIKSTIVESNLGICQSDREAEFRNETYLDWVVQLWPVEKVDQHWLVDVLDLEAVPAVVVQQVWSKTRFYSVDFSPSRIDVKMCVFKTHNQGFLSAVLDGVLGPPRLGWHNLRCP